MKLHLRKSCKRFFGSMLAAAGVALALGMSSSNASAKDVLVADRLSDSVYRYSADGTFLNVVLAELDEEAENDLINQPTGLAISPDGTQLYVSSSQTNTVVRYDYDPVTGTASNAFVFASEEDGLQFPNAIVFNPAGDTIYIANLGGTGITRLNVDGTSAGLPLSPFQGGAFNQFSGLAWTPTGELLANGFVDFPGGASGAVGKSDAAVDSLATFIGPSTSLMGAAGILVHEDFVYVTGLFASNLQRFSLADGSLDSSFGVTELTFPQGLMAAPDGNGFLAGILGYANGAGHIAHYDFDGNLIGDGVFAAPSEDGFTEATAFITVPDLPGDFNGDRIVDGADLDAWKTNFGDSSGQATLAMGDADGNGIVDGADFLIWQRHVTATPVAEAQAVPEPTGLVLMTLAFAALTFRGSAATEATS